MEFNKGETGLGYGALAMDILVQKRGYKIRKIFSMIFSNEISLNVQNLGRFSDKVQRQ